MILTTSVPDGFGAPATRPAAGESAGSADPPRLAPLRVEWGGRKLHPTQRPPLLALLLLYVIGVVEVCSLLPRVRIVWHHLPPLPHSLWIRRLLPNHLRFKWFRTPQPLIVVSIWLIRTSRIVFIFLPCFPVKLAWLLEALIFIVFTFLRYALTFASAL